MHGLLLVDKPSGWTSFDVVSFVRKTIAQAEDKKPRQIKVGHTGTLDPLATGLLVLLVGDYTKRASEFLKLNKTYEVTIKLGETSSTGDGEGILSKVSIKQPTTSEIGAALQKLTGKLMQTPPAFSAIKINGKRAYALARAGQAVTLEPRPVEVFSNELTSYVYPFITCTVEVSSGTYIRSLVEDLGDALDTGAYMRALRRTVVGPFRLNDAIEVGSITGANFECRTYP